MRVYLEHQDLAHRMTLRLMAALALALGGSIVATTLAVSYLIGVAAYALDHYGAEYDPLTGYPVRELSESPLDFAASPVMLLCVAAVSAIVVGVGSLLKTAELRRLGGAVIAENLGGVMIQEGEGDVDRRKILNVVEEMAIATGIPAPPVFLLARESGINAFAAGDSPQDAVLGVTTGCVQRLTRDQLQGVIAHEFSHVLNGDMRLNLRVMGVLHGIFSITLIAEWLIKNGFEFLNDPSESNRAGPVVAVFMILGGAMLWPIGLVGAFWGMLIMAAMNRQREWLADSSAVEFTRDPQGLAGALKVIAGYAKGTAIRHPNAIEASHFFFAEGLGGWGKLLASHPPVDQRIRRLDPAWDGTPLFEAEEQLEDYHAAHQNALNFVGAAPRRRASTDSIPAADTFKPNPAADQANEILDRTGFSDAAQWSGSQQYVEQLIDDAPRPLLELAQDPDGAPVMLWALWIVLGEEDALINDQLFSHWPPRLSQAVAALGRNLQPTDGATRLLLLDLAAETLDLLTAEERRSIFADAQPLLQSPRTCVARWAWGKIVQQRLSSDKNDDAAIFGSLCPVAELCEIVISTLVYAGGEGDISACYAFQRAAVHLDLPDLSFRFRHECDLQSFDHALTVLSQTAARPRRQIMAACSTCITANQLVSEEEAYLIRGICFEFGYTPPLLYPGQVVAPGV